MRRNVNFWIDIRNAVAHRHLPALDPTVIPFAQAGLLAFESVIETEFGDEYCLAEALSVPLQLSGFRDPGVLVSLKKLQASLPLDVQAVLSDAANAPPEVLADSRYMMRVAFIPFIPFVPSSGRSPDAVAHFFKPGQVPSELDEMLERYVVLQKSNQSARPSIKATQVVEEVRRRTGLRFDSNLHAAAARSLSVRTEKGEPEKTLALEFADYVTAFKQWVYTQAWIDRLVAELSDPESFEKITGKPARPASPPESG